MARIAQREMDKMFAIANVEQRLLHRALCRMGPKHLKDATQRRMWSPSRPTTQFCYVISEWLFAFRAPEGTVPFKLLVPNTYGLHRFLKWPDGSIVDLAVDQFDNFEDVEYADARVCYFLRSGMAADAVASKRATLLEQYMRELEA